MPPTPFSKSSASTIGWHGISVTSESDFEDGGWISQPASAVLAARYGDCKAHATILKALLAVQGIEANLVAVNADMQYTLTEVATANFDHAIVYVPEIDQYLDPTASSLAFGSLPFSLGGKPALNIDKGTFARIPVPTPERFTLAADTQYELASDGTRQARSILSGTGSGASLGRSLAQDLETVDRQNTARKLIEQAGLKGTGDYSFPNPRELSDNYAITSTFQISTRVDLGERWTVRLLPLTDIRPSILFLSTGGATDRPFRCRSLEYRETSVLTIPDEFNFDQKPAPVAYRKSVSGKTQHAVRQWSHRSKRSRRDRRPDRALQRRCPADVRRAALPRRIRRSHQGGSGRLQ